MFAEHFVQKWRVFKKHLYPREQETPILFCSEFSKQAKDALPKCANIAKGVHRARQDLVAVHRRRKSHTCSMAVPKPVAVAHVESVRVFIPGNFFFFLRFLFSRIILIKII
jgi:hypothetical protein